MSKLKRLFPIPYQLFMKIAEPRIIRLIHFGVYIFMFVAGLGVVFRPTPNFEHVLGSTLVHIMGGFMLVGALLGAFAVLPGIWWLERSGLWLLMSSLLSYIVVVVALGGTMAGVAISAALIMTFIIRWLEIRRYQLAPREE